MRNYMKTKKETTAKMKKHKTRVIHEKMKTKKNVKTNAQKKLKINNLMKKETKK